SVPFNIKRMPPAFPRESLNCFDATHVRETSGGRMMFWEGALSLPMLIHTESTVTALRINESFFGEAWRMAEVSSDAFCGRICFSCSFTTSWNGVSCAIGDFVSCV